jgi:hypothetical protein
MAELDKRTPHVGLRFRNPDEAWLFWVAYGGHTGFDVRKDTVIQANLMGR